MRRISTLPSSYGRAPAHQIEETNGKRSVSALALLLRRFTFLPAVASMTMVDTATVKERSLKIAVLEETSVLNRALGTPQLRCVSLDRLPSPPPTLPSLPLSLHQMCSLLPHAVSGHKTCCRHCGTKTAMTAAQGRGCRGAEAGQDTASQMDEQTPTRPRERRVDGMWDQT